jgi:hypothetical protein
VRLPPSILYLPSLSPMRPFEFIRRHLSTSHHDHEKFIASSVVCNSPVRGYSTVAIPDNISRHRKDYPGVIITRVLCAFQVHCNRGLCRTLLSTHGSTSQNVAIRDGRPAKHAFIASSPRSGTTICISDNTTHRGIPGRQLAVRRAVLVRVHSNDCRYHERGVAKRTV